MNNKKEKKFSFKKYMKKIMKSSKTTKDKKKEHKESIKKNLGGGEFTKIEII